MISRETEIKIDLGTKENYLKLLTELNVINKASRQDNYFIDTEDFRLGRVGWAVRIRIENDRASFTLKGPAENGPAGLAVRPELIRALPVDKALIYIDEGLRARELPEEFKPYLTPDLKEDLLRVAVSFVNYRVTVPCPLESNLNLEIDRTIFDDKIENYELEVELPDKINYGKALEILADLFKGPAIPLKMQTESKLARAMRFWRERNAPPGV